MWWIGVSILVALGAASARASEGEWTPLEPVRPADGPNGPLPSHLAVRASRTEDTLTLGVLNDSKEPAGPLTVSVNLKDSSKDSSPEEQEPTRWLPALAPGQDRWVALPIPGTLIPAKRLSVSLTVQAEPGARTWKQNLLVPLIKRSPFPHYLIFAALSITVVLLVLVSVLYSTRAARQRQAGAPPGTRPSGG